MRQVVIVSGVLGGGSALVFALAAVVASAFPTGTLVPSGWNGGWARDGFRVAPAVRGPLIVDDAEGGDVMILEQPAIDVVLPPPDPVAVP